MQQHCGAGHRQAGSVVQRQRPVRLDANVERTVSVRYEVARLHGDGGQRPLRGPAALPIEQQTRRWHLHAERRWRLAGIEAAVAAGGPNRAEE